MSFGADIVGARASPKALALRIRASRANASQVNRTQETAKPESTATPKTAGR
jgi:hypothetical protein